MVEVKESASDLPEQSGSPPKTCDRSTDTDSGVHLRDDEEEEEDMEVHPPATEHNLSDAILQELEDSLLRGSPQLPEDEGEKPASTDEPDEPNTPDSVVIKTPW